jgi:hypothetical protein
VEKGYSGSTNYRTKEQTLMICGHCKDRNVTVAHVKAHTQPTGYETQSEPTYGTKTVSVEEFVREHGDKFHESDFGPVETITVEPQMHPVTEEGMYLMGKAAGHSGANLIYRVVASKDSGRLYAKRSTPDGFEYDKGAIFRLFAEDRMTVEEVAEVGRRDGYCYVCGRHLTNPESVALGIGPICGGRV